MVSILVLALSGYSLDGKSYCQSESPSSSLGMGFSGSDLARRQVFSYVLCVASESAVCCGAVGCRRPFWWVKWHTPHPSPSGRLPTAGDPCDMGMFLAEVTTEPGTRENMGVATGNAVAVSIGEPGARSSSLSSTRVMEEGITLRSVLPDASSVNCGGVWGPGQSARGFTTPAASSLSLSTASHLVAESAFFKSRGV